MYMENTTLFPFLPCLSPSLLPPLSLPPTHINKHKEVFLQFLINVHSKNNVLVKMFLVLFYYLRIICFHVEKLIRVIKETENHFVFFVGSH